MDPAKMRIKPEIAKLISLDLNQDLYLELLFDEQLIFDLTEDDEQLVSLTFERLYAKGYFSKI